MTVLTALAPALRAEPLLRLTPDEAALAGVETPGYVFSPEVVMARHAQLRTALGTPLIVSVKANPNIDLFVRCGQAFNDGVELASVGELNLVVGRAATPKYVTSPALDPPFLAAAIASRATVLLDSLDQVAMVEAAAVSKGKPGRFGLRLNAASLLDLPSTAAQADHFGLDLASARAACQRLEAAGAGVAGLHVYAGSYSFGSMSLPLARRAASVLDELQAQLSAPLEFFNLGGGFSEDWEDDDRLAAYRSQIAPLQKRISVVHESGRAIYADCGAFVTRVIAVKTLDDRAVVVCDGGLAQAFLLAQTEKMLKAPHEPRVIRRSPRPTLEAVRRVQVVGNSCNRADVIGLLPPAERPSPGDLLVFDRCGAYHTYSPTGFLNLRPATRFVLS